MSMIRRSTVVRMCIIICLIGIFFCCIRFFCCIAAAAGPITTTAAGSTTTQADQTTTPGATTTTAPTTTTTVPAVPLLQRSLPLGPSVDLGGGLNGVPLGGLSGLTDVPRCTSDPCRVRKL